METLPKILIVDDDEQQLWLLRRMLETIEAEIVEASDAESALIEVTKHELSLIILDVNLPGTNGFELAKLIRKTRYNVYVPIIFITAIFKEEQYIHRGFEAGAVDYIEKSLDPRILVSKVKIHLDMSRSRKEIERTRQLYTVIEQTNQLIRLSNRPDDRLSTDHYRLGAMADMFPVKSEELVQRYILVLEKRMEGSVDDVDEILQEIASELGYLGAKPRDAIDLHLNCFFRFLKGEEGQHEKLFHVGNLLLIELMWHLLHFYRRLF